MGVLVATNHLQGSRDGDFAHAVEGELLVVEVADREAPQATSARFCRRRTALRAGVRTDSSAR